MQLNLTSASFHPLSKDLMKSRDQMLRKAEQENDSLSFRNQQLTKRLTLLQEDLDEIQVNTN